MRKVFVLLIVAAALLLTLSVSALATGPITKEVASFQTQEAFLAISGDFLGYAVGYEWNANGVDTTKGGGASCHFEDTLEGIVIDANEDPMPPNWFSFGKDLESAKLTIPALFTYDSEEYYPGTVQVRWEGVGDIFSYPDGHDSRIPTPPGPWSELDKLRISLQDRSGNATITVICPGLDYEKTVTAASPQDDVYMGWLSAHGVHLVK